jgi:hypothetical protein
LIFPLKAPFIVDLTINIPFQWPFQEPKIGGTYHIFLAYFLGLNFRESPHNSYGLKNGTVPPSIGS